MSDQDWSTEWKQKWDAKKHGISIQSHPFIMTFLPQRNANAVPVARFGKQLQVRANDTFTMGPNLEPCGTKVSGHVGESVMVGGWAREEMWRIRPRWCKWKSQNSQVMYREETHVK
ncbi:hypothetical protein E4U38_005030 [Claviceps purpurea]|nr:hypothetical protein E4U38_005030 [Claviceps purpurea]KAG6149274.1 hypothetical protein E4U28_001942 [Claviceps purpurea]KAG6157924.1 hypothetical protein E4U11_005024 [Claviceps purpurea]KAG6174321.1 hypothetical protein E4U51_002544 [Claviceps purpurea]KAG6190521.1 hypothetical protein E4U36_002586 [Claviceps purpurea]